MDDADVLRDLAPVARTLLERHLANAKEWFPHHLVPWSRGRDFSPGESWEPEQAPMDEAVRSALLVNLLTEDNLPHYFRTIGRMFGPDDPWGYWSRRWTAEEGRHSIVIRDYLTVTRSVDPVALERGRMNQVTLGEVPEPETVADGLVYVALQELATRVSHSNTGRLLDDEMGFRIMARVAGDEMLHHIFYRDLTSALLELDPSGTMLAIDRNVRNFAMPGTGIEGFGRKAAAIAKAGIYNNRLHHDTVLKGVVLEYWNIEGLEGLSPAAEQARVDCLAYMAELDRKATQQEEWISRRSARK